MGKVNDFLMSFCSVSIMIMVPVMTGVIFLQVVLRYVFSAPLAWPEELARYLLVWISCLGAAYAVRKGMHISVVFIKERLPGVMKSVVILLGQCLVMAFFVFCVFYGVLDAYEEWYQKTAALRIPMTFPKLAIPVGFGIMVMLSLELLIQEVSEMISGKGSSKNPNERLQPADQDCFREDRG